MSNKRKVSKSSRNNRDKERKSSRWSSSGDELSLNSSRSNTLSPINLEKKIGDSRVMPLSSLISDPSALAATAISCMDWRMVEGMLPPCIKGKSSNEIIRLVTEELEGMSKKRIIGQDISWSSSSEESLSDNGTEKGEESNEENVNTGKNSALMVLRV
uniref:PDE4_UCR domain-containing protein n=1 Tax=Heterorhabditis bacteriophora TaxID=37862 RepID=A0A1I7XUP0_HETBA